MNMGELRLWGCPRRLSPPLAYNRLPRRQGRAAGRIEAQAG